MTKPIYTHPKSIKLNITENKFEIIWRRINFYVILMILLTTIWNCFIFITSMDDLKNKMFLELFPIPGIHILIGLYLTYYNLAILFNKLEITIKNNKIIIRDLIIPMGHKRKIDLAEIIQFESIKQTYINRKRQPTFQINYILKTGKRKNLIYGFHEKEESDFIVSKLNSYLGLEKDTGKNIGYMSLDTPREILSNFYIVLGCSIVLIILSILSNIYL